MTSIERKFFAYLDELNIITILLPLSYHQGLSSSFYITKGFENSSLPLIKKSKIENYVKYICKLPFDFCFGQQYWVIDEHKGKTDLQIGAVIRTEGFDQKFYYSGSDLGVTYGAEGVCFKLWAPTAVQVKLKLRPPDSSYSEIIKLKRVDQGIWSIVLNRELDCWQYSFLVLVNQEWHEAVDPYVKAVTANGKLGVIVNLEQTREPRAELPQMETPVDAVIYETHIRDFTIHPNSGVTNKGLYLGACEIETRGQDGGATGLSYLKELGITHLQLMPFHDFAGVNELNQLQEYNWGYNPLHFNTPEGSYSTDPSNPYARILELKKLIKQIHQAGLKVIMDVVYNHVYIREESSFEKVVPGYYFRHNEMGLPSNGTGVGNDIASERKMVRKFIVDSVRFWMEEYHIDGFRFDLMGILDIETMKEVRTVCEHLLKDVIIIGEGWDLNTPLPIEQKAIIANQAKLPGVAQFNDVFRDCIKGNTFNLLDKGYAMGNEHDLEAACESIAGSIGFKTNGHGLFNEPDQSVNYVECHDNHTMWDKLLACFPNAEDPFRRSRHRLATGIVLLSQGIPFLHSGQEFFRTKHGDGNSYRSPDSVNQLDWDRKIEFKDNVEYIKGIIQLRKTFACFRMRTAKEIRNCMTQLPADSPILGLFYQYNGDELILVINPSEQSYTFSLPNGEWSVLVNAQYAGVIPNGSSSREQIILEPVSLNVLMKK
ncbi:type I pullulanase [Bacillus sp. BRMEA1]|uniref:type I pullulanase n=1 Tax=Neobacillus endophyticus TaxID=2738405 RepID=UPI001566682E|nr:type I pullulanase [Neobacillus endophyticus]NRD76160.1 type I pullulanase [Neobacillus endophyticus]